MRSKSVCLCDDDNDVEMALACSHAYIPALSLDTMEETIQQNPKQFTKTFLQGVVEGTFATEAALRLVYERVISAQNF